MANTKVTANGLGVTLWWALPNYAVNPKNPTAAEINATVNVTNSTAWDGYSFGTQASNQNSDPSVGDVGNTQTRGFAQFGGTVSFFYPRNYTDTSNEYLTTFLAIDKPRTLGYLIIRSDGKKTTAGADDKNKVAVTGDFVSIYKVMSDGWQDSVVGELGFKYAITFQPQGDLWVNAQVGTFTTTTPVAIGTPNYVSPLGKTPLGTYRSGRQLAAVANEWNGYPGAFSWSSSDPTKATVDANGVVHAVAAGTASITATEKITGIASTALSVTIT
jgi:Bacterial Ig-like domain (group 2).